MNERIREIAKEAGWPDSLVAPVIMDKLLDFAELVRADEREACAALCSAVAAGRDAEAIEEAIRARSEK